MINWNDDIEALDDCIKLWGKRARGELVRSGECALCKLDKFRQLFNNGREACELCIIKLDTENVRCYETPFYWWRDAAASKHSFASAKPA
ncbi:MAG: hypothetical protein KAS32_23525 [Candidatus Peribacteraceae bacterium]|nr:hypothetical protein [Candidatus Peribacteraceae bacterium]